MEELLQLLLNRLEQIGHVHEELYGTECREMMSNAVAGGFLRDTPDYVVPSTFGLHSPAANFAVRIAITAYIGAAKSMAAQIGVVSFHERLAAFQDARVKSEKEGLYFDDFFGYWSPDAFDSMGKAKPA